jgi:F-type H+-transporting ATPase subunit g
MAGEGTYYSILQNNRLLLHGGHRLFLKEVAFVCDRLVSECPKGEYDASPKGPQHEFSHIRPFTSLIKKMLRAPRTLLRSSWLPSSAPRTTIRSASTKETAQEQAQKALGSAQKTAGKALEGAKELSGKVGSRIGGLLGCEWLINSLVNTWRLTTTHTNIAYRQPLIYNLQVTRELLKQIYVREGLSPPTSVSAFTEAYSTLFQRARDPNYWREIAKNGEWAKVAVYGLEAYFIFNIGEMIGRRHLVGYKLD